MENKSVVGKGEVLINRFSNEVSYVDMGINFRVNCVVEIDDSHKKGKDWQMSADLSVSDLVFKDPLSAFKLHKNKKIADMQKMAELDMCSVFRTFVKGKDGLRTPAETLPFLATVHLERWPWFYGGQLVHKDGSKQGEIIFSNLKIVKK